MIPFWVKKTEENRDICRWKKESFTSKVEITRNLLNKDIKKENFKKNLMDLIEKNYQISMTSDQSVSSNNLFKRFLKVKSFNMFLTL